MGLEDEDLTGSVIGAAVVRPRLLAAARTDPELRQAIEIKPVIASERPHQWFLASCLP